MPTITTNGDRGTVYLGDELDRDYSDRPKPTRRALTRARGDELERQGHRWKGQKKRKPRRTP